MSRNDDYTTGNLLDYSNHQNYHKVTGNLQRQTNIANAQQINLIAKLEENNGAVMFFYRWKAAEIYSKFFSRFIKGNRTI